ncbi:hypothetical protein BKA93DRAFT_751762 [Sparassis latifolia]
MSNSIKRAGRSREKALSEFFPSNSIIGYVFTSQTLLASEFGKLQADSETRIKNGCPLDCTGPPVSIYHPVFTEFLDHAADPSTILSANVLKAMHEIFQYLSEFYADELVRQNKINELLTKLLDMSSTEPRG